MKQAVKNICLALLWCFMSLHITAQGVVINKADGTKDYYKASEVLSVGVYGYGEDPEPDSYTGSDQNGHKWVDLGLPSGTLWATCNVGANSPEEYGGYFAWGETSTKNKYNPSTYKYCKVVTEYGWDYWYYTKYCIKSDEGYNGFTDGKTELLSEDDAATANWGSEWQMPSSDQMDELNNSSYTTTEWTTVNGVHGIKITSKNNSNSVFLPAAGHREDTSLKLAGKDGLYYTRSLEPYSNCPYDLCFASDEVWSLCDRFCGRSIRPVRVQK